MKLIKSKNGDNYNNQVTYSKNKVLKAVILTAIFTTILVGNIGVVAVTLTAKDIGFTSSKEEWQVNNVEDAMNDLYTMGSNYKAEAVSDIKYSLSHRYSSSFQINVAGYTQITFVTSSSTDSLTIKDRTSGDTLGTVPKGSNNTVTIDVTDSTVIVCSFGATGSYPVVSGTYSLIS